MINISIKRVQSSDVTLLAQIAQQAYLDHYRPIWHDEGAWYVEKVYNVPQLLSEIQDENVLYFLVYNDRIPIGFVKLKKNYPLSIGSAGLPFGNGAGSSVALNNALYLERIYFIKSATGNGLGNYCFNFIKKYARENDKTAIWLMAMDWSEKAIRFYEKQGFEKCGTWQLGFEIMKQEHWGMVILSYEFHSTHNS